MSRRCPRERPVLSATREEAVRTAIHSNSLEDLQELSLLPGGFGEARKQAWPYLLGVVSSNEIDTSISDTWELTFRDYIAGLSTSRTPSQQLDSAASIDSENVPTSLSDHSLDAPSSPNFSDATDISPHPDEHQVQLDTDRSFVLYPIVQSSANQKQHLQEDLHDIIIGVLRKRPALRYFQGYHDIVTVLFLTLPAPLVLPSAEKISLHRLRDSMGKGLEPLVGQLRILKRLLRMVDPPYAEVLERSSPLPYYALSNLLTLFAHDVPTLPLIQHVFDWLLCREPIASIWLAAAVILSRKEDVLALEREGDEALGMIHAVLTTMPSLSEDDVSIQSARSSVNAIHTLTESSTPEENFDSLSNIAMNEGTSATAFDPPEYEPFDSTLHHGSDHLTNSSTINSPISLSVAISTPITEFDCIETDYSQVDGFDIDISEMEQSLPETQSRPHSPSTSVSLPGGYAEKPNPPAIPLPTLLCHASELLVAYPPSSPMLRLTETFGLQSALRTNGLNVPELFTSLPDDVAESFVGGDNVVLPMSQEEEDEETFYTNKPKKRGSGQKKSRNGGTIRIANGLVLRRQTVVAGVVLLLGVAVALYGFPPGGRCGRNGNIAIGSSKIRYAAVWVGGLLGLGERFGVGV